jgi:hypothetical protein
VAAAARREEQGLDLSALLGLQQDMVRCPYALYDQARSGGGGYDDPVHAQKRAIVARAFTPRLPSYISHGPARPPLRARAAAPRPAAAGAHPGAGDG